MSVTNNSELVLVTLWATEIRKDQLAVLAVKNRQNEQETRWYWGLPGWPVVKGTKLLGFVDLPFAAPGEALDFMHGYSNPVHGYPFMCTFDEVI